MNFRTRAAIATIYAGARLASATPWLDLEI
jgi:hypothetical protein